MIPFGLSKILSLVVLLGAFLDSIKTRVSGDLLLLKKNVKLILIKPSMQQTEEVTKQIEMKSLFHIQ